jgi:hypothetical protein
MSIVKQYEYHVMKLPLFYSWLPKHNFYVPSFLADAITGNGTIQIFTGRFLLLRSGYPFLEKVGAGHFFGENITMKLKFTILMYLLKYLILSLSFLYLPLKIQKKYLLVLFFIEHCLVYLYLWAERADIFWILGYPNTTKLSVF